MLHSKESSLGGAQTPLAEPLAADRELEEQLFAVWSQLPAEQRRLWFRVFDAFLPADSPLLEMLEDFEAARFADAARVARLTDTEPVIPFAQLLAVGAGN